jgi:carbonic anhydrase
MKTFFCCALFLLLSLLIVPAFAADHDEAQKVAPQEALQMLIDGNARFVAGKLAHPHETLDRAKDTAINGQHPFVTILSCSDSRAPLDVIFDQGIGDIFSIRVAGNVGGEHELGSIEYGVEHAGTQLCVILGHTKCGAVTAASTGGGDEGNIKSLMLAIRPAVQRTETETGKTGKEIVEPCAVHNVFYQMETLYKGSVILRRAVRSGELIIVGAIYDIETGKVEILGPHPKTEELIKEPTFTIGVDFLEALPKTVELTKETTSDVEENRVVILTPLPQSVEATTVMTPVIEMGDNVVEIVEPLQVAKVQVTQEPTKEPVFVLAPLPQSEKTTTVTTPVIGVGSNVVEIAAPLPKPVEAVKVTSSVIETGTGESFAPPSEHGKITKEPVRVERTERLRALRQMLLHPFTVPPQ